MESIDLRELNVCVRIRSESRPALGCRIGTCIASRVHPPTRSTTLPSNPFSSYDSSRIVFLLTANFEREKSATNRRKGHDHRQKSRIS